MRLRSSILEVMAALKIYKRNGRNILGLGRGGSKQPVSNEKIQRALANGNIRAILSSTISV
jgi:hypothetical protein